MVTKDITLIARWRANKRHHLLRVTQTEDGSVTWRFVVRDDSDMQVEPPTIGIGLSGLTDTCVILRASLEVPHYVDFVLLEE